MTEKKNQSVKKTLSEKNLFNIRLTTSSESDILEYIFSTLQHTTNKLSIFTPNPEIIVKAHKDPTYKEILNSGSILLPDGAGLIISSWVLGSPLLYRITGVDFMTRLAQETSLRSKTLPLSVGFLGSKPGIALKTAQCLQRAFPELKVSFIGEEWPVSHVTHQGESGGIFIPASWQAKIAESNFGNMKELKKTITEEKSGNIDILFVAFGAPKQEEWIAKNLSRLPIRVAMGVGGAFDFLSGTVPRAPWLIRFIGFEWLYRLVKEPWRWRRQLSLLTFVKLVCEEYIAIIKASFRKQK